jgi:hypothetical protein
LAVVLAGCGGAPTTETATAALEADGLTVNPDLSCTLTCVGIDGVVAMQKGEIGTSPLYPRWKDVRDACPAGTFCLGDAVDRPECDSQHLYTTWPGHCATSN